ncbi:GTPase Obg-like [Clytia hemisphaerica]|uniref:GTPase Obg-like n=1 Tax=Clytia hemisphaerica TaxID=252671 RepID=UPI0034D5F541
MLMYCRNHLSRLKLSNKVIISSSQCGCSTQVSPPLKKKRKLIYAKGKTFVDWKRIYIKSGNGSASFFHSRDHKGGPEGGDGGRGADVIFIADDAYSQLSHLEHQYRAKNGGNGSKKNRHGKNGEHIHIHVLVMSISSHLQDCVQESFTEGGTGEEIFVELELKSIADIGLVGFPNAGKSSLLHCISRATPKIGDYPFTTLKPNIGVMNLKDDLTVSVD